MSTSKNSMGTPRTMRSIFGIIMIIVYLGMGVLFFIGFFDWFKGGWAWFRWVGGTLFVAYGLWRAYRQFKGLDDPYATPDDDK